jgi:hypothetical protein
MVNASPTAVFVLLELHRALLPQASRYNCSTFRLSNHLPCEIHNHLYNHLHSSMHGPCRRGECVVDHRRDHQTDALPCTDPGVYKRFALSVSRIPIVSGCSKQCPTHRWVVCFIFEIIMISFGVSLSGGPCHTQANCLCDTPRKLLRFLDHSVRSSRSPLPFSVLQQHLRFTRDTSFVTVYPFLTDPFMSARIK